jgi:hypothetical protein
MCWNIFFILYKWDNIDFIYLAFREMKKVLYCFIIFSLLFSGCSFSQKESTNISFSDATNIFTDSMSDFYLQNIKLLNTKWVEYHTFCNVQWWNNDINLHSSIDLSWQETDTETGNKVNKDMIFDFYYQDRNKPNWNMFQWNLLFQKVWWDYFFKLSDWIANLGTWNYEWEFIGLLIDNLWDKWINYTPTFSQKIDDVYSKYLEFLRLFIYPNLFENLWEISYEWDPAYNTNKWTMISRWNNDIELKFDDLKIIYQEKPYYIKWNISWTHWNLIITDDKESTHYLEISREKRKLNLLFNISDIIDFQKMRELELNINNFRQTNTRPLKYNMLGTLKISPKLIYWSNLEKEVKINISCSYEKNSLSWDLSISKPDSFLLLDQILWDSFSLKSIIWDTDFN